MPYNYSEAEILKEVGSGQDAKRRRDMDVLAAKAQAGDPDALRRLYFLSDPDGPGGQGAATPDARNYGRLLLQKLGPQLQQAGYDPSLVSGYMKKGDGGGFFGSLGDVLKVAAPIGAAFIPGIGPLAAGGIGAAGSAAGGALKGESFDLIKTILAGGGAAGGNLLLGGQGPGGIKGIPGRLGLGGGAKPLAPAGALGRPGGETGTLQNTGGGGGFWDKIGKLPWEHIASGAGAGLGLIGQNQAREAQERNANAMLELRRKMLEMGEKNYASKEGLRTGALAHFAKPQRPSIFSGGN